MAYNEEHPDKVKYGQRLLIASDATPGVDNPATQAAATATIQSSRAAIDATLLADDLDAIVAPGNTYANVSAAAGYPTVVVPAGYANRRHGALWAEFPCGWLQRAATDLVRLRLRASHEAPGPSDRGEPGLGARSLYVTERRCLDGR